MTSSHALPNTSFIIDLITVETGSLCSLEPVFLRLSFAESCWGSWVNPFAKSR